MIRLDRIFRDYREAGALNELIALWGFVDDSTFVTKAGDVGLVFAMKGPDATALTHEQRLRLTHQFESALRLLNERVHVYQYFVKEQAKPFVPASAGRAVAAESFHRRAVFLNGRRSQLFTVSQYLVLLLEHDRFSGVHRSFRQLCASPIAAIRERLSVRETVTLVEAQLEVSVRALDQLASSVAVQLADCSLRKLHKQEAFRFLRRLVNFDAHVVDASHLRYDTHLDYFIADSPASTTSTATPHAIMNWSDCFSLNATPGVASAVKPTASAAPKPHESSCPIQATGRSRIPRRHRSVASSKPLPAA